MVLSIALIIAGSLITNNVLSFIVMVFGFLLLISQFITIQTVAKPQILVVDKDEFDKAKQQGEISRSCPPHKWTYGPDNFLYCSVCNGKPGQFGTNYHGEY